MRKLFFILICFICAGLRLPAQVNFVMNPDLELYDTCPDDWNQITYAKWWSSAIDTVGTAITQMEYYNSCAGSNVYASTPVNIYFLQSPHSGNGIAGGHLFFDGTLPPPPTPWPSTDYRDYLQGHLYRKLDAGKTYCVKFWMNSAEMSTYQHNKIGAYLDDGTINKCGLLQGAPLTFVMPQVYTDSVIGDTARWIPIEGSFTAIGNERIITIGNFALKKDLTYSVLPGSAWSTGQYSYYLIDDISVIPLDLPANAGSDTWVAKGDSVQIGRVGDTTTIGLDCKWYRRGTLIDSGAIIWAKGNGLVGDVDTYAVVQTICGLIKTDTVVVYTVPVGIQEIPRQQQFNLYPNPSDGHFTISNSKGNTQETIHATVYDPSGRILFNTNLQFKANTAQLQLNTLPGTYILQLSDQVGNKQHIRLVVR